MEIVGKNTSHLSTSFYFLIIGSCFFSKSLFNQQGKPMGFCFGISQRKPVKH